MTTLLIARSLPAFAAAAALAACAPSATDEAGRIPVACDAALASGETVPGGWTGGASGAEADEAQAFALDELYRRFPTRALVERVTAESQVVAGMNYHFIVEMSGSAGSSPVYDIIVYRDLEGEMSVTKLELACTQ
jgi:hypothetical protein